MRIRRAKMPIVSNPSNHVRLNRGFASQRSMNGVIMRRQKSVVAYQIFHGGTVEMLACISTPRYAAIVPNVGTMVETRAITRRNEKISRERRKSGSRFDLRRRYAPTKAVSVWAIGTMAMEIKGDLNTIVLNSDAA